MKMLLKAAALSVECMITFLFLITYGASQFFIPATQKDAEIKKKITITHGENITSIATLLKHEGIIRYKWPFEISARFFSNSTLKAGEYDLSSGMSSFDLAHILGKGVKKQEQELTIIEGWDAAEIADSLEREHFITKDAFLKDVKSGEFDEHYSIFADKPRGESLEGYLFPDTYRVFFGSTGKDLIIKMVENLEKKYTPTMRSDTQSRGMTIFNILTLASIIEQEVQTDEDRGRVADIFYRRLSIGMPLQSDATVNYVTGKRALQPTFNDLESNSLYNTYKHRGLPPGPISNPGLSSIKASIYPISNSYVYFLTTPEGKVVYSKTYNEHLAAKRKYLSK